MSEPAAATSAASQPPQQRPGAAAREPGTLIAAFAAWLRRQVRADGDPQVQLLARSGAAGFSSETLLCDAKWVAGGVAASGSFALRLPPSEGSYPLFPSYDLARQAEVMRLVARHCEAPVPAVRWYEPDASVLGAPFIVMDRVDGEAAPDVMPYTFDSWLTRATPRQRGQVQDRAVGVLARIHDMRVTREQLRFLDPAASHDAFEDSLRRHVEQQRAYSEWVCRSAPQPLIEALFGWLERHWPRSAGGAVVNWGDARLANILWRDFRPVAVLDWEMAALAPREVDLGWFLYFHQYFQGVAERHGRPGLPDFLTPDSVVRRYEGQTGHRVRDLPWFLAYAALREALISIRVVGRAVAFGERARPADPADLILDRARLEAIVSTAPDS